MSSICIYFLAFNFILESHLLYVCLCICVRLMVFWMLIFIKSMFEIQWWHFIVLSQICFSPQTYFEFWKLISFPCRSQSLRGTPSLWSSFNQNQFFYKREYVRQLSEFNMSETTKLIYNPLFPSINLFWSSFKTRIGKKTDLMSILFMYFLLSWKFAQFFIWNQSQNISICSFLYDFDIESLSNIHASRNKYLEEKIE